MAHINHRSLHVSLFVGMRETRNFCSHFGSSRACLVSMRKGCNFGYADAGLSLDYGELHPTLVGSTSLFSTTPIGFLRGLFHEAFGESARTAFRTLEAKGNLHLIKNTAGDIVDELWFLMFDHDRAMFDTMVDMRKFGSFEIEDGDTLATYAKEEARVKRYNAAGHRPKSIRGIKIPTSMLKGAKTIRLYDPKKFWGEQLVCAQLALVRTQELLAKHEACRRQPMYAAVVI